MRKWKESETEFKYSPKYFVWYNETAENGGRGESLFQIMIDTFTWPYMGIAA